MPSVRPRWSERRIWWTATAILVAWWAVAIGLSAVTLMWLGFVETWTGLIAMIVGGSVIAFLIDRGTSLLQRRSANRPKT